MKILVSACLAGERTRFDGTACPDDKIISLLDRGLAVPACPEILGGLRVPRPAAEIVGGDGSAVLDGKARVMTADGGDVTAAYLAGAERTLAAARAAGCRAAIMKSKSPACAVLTIFDGTFSGKVQSGNGVAAAALARAGIAIISDETEGFEFDGTA